MRRSAGWLLLGALALSPLRAAHAPGDCATNVAPRDAAALRAAYAGAIEGWPRPCVLPGVAWREMAPLPRTAPAPADNPTTTAKADLGERLFHDPRLSKSGQIACASCHERDLGWADGRRVSFGHDRTPAKRNAPSVRYAGHARSLFWDGRADSLEAQALSPIEHAAEMAFSRQGLSERLATLDDYRDAAQAVFGRDALTVDDVTRALAAFQRSLARPRGRYQRFLNGHRDALGDEELRGLHLFRTKAGCMNCHHGPTLSDDRFHNLGLSFHGTRRQDLGRYAVTGDPADVGAFRTPSLLGVGDTAPYMHAGLFADLRGVLRLYDAGMPRRIPKAAQADDPLFPQPTPLVRPLGLDERDVEALAAFLETL